MDIKSKSNKMLGILVGLLLIMALAVGIVMFYTPIYDNSIVRQKQSDEMLKSQEDQFNAYSKEQFMRELYKSNFILLMDVLRVESQTYLKASDIFLPESVNGNRSENNNVNPSTVVNAEDGYDYSINASENYHVIYDSSEVVFNVEQEYLNQFNDVIYNWGENFYNGTLRVYPSFLYYVSNQKTGRDLTNSVDQLKLLMDSSSNAQKLKGDLSFYMILQTDAEGKLSVSDYKGVDQKYIDSLLSMHLVNDVLQEESNYVQINGSYRETHQFKNLVKLPSNLTVIYASKSDDFYKSGTYYYDYDMDATWTFLNSGFEYVFATALFAVFMFAMVLPFVRYLGIGRGFSTRVPLEVSVAGIGASMVVFFEEFAYIAWSSVNNGFVFDTDVTVFPLDVQKMITYGANILVWMLFLSIWYLGFLSMRQVFTLGLRRFIREKTLIGRFFSWCIRKTKANMVALRTVDLQDKTNKNIIKILLINYVVLAIISLFWMFGVVILIPYTFTVFFIVRKYLADLKLHYNTLLEATSKIADGNLDVSIDENLGVFEPIKEELAKIVQGFAKAVQEETKSERMKTELITNVSHDLKTPLTAIITYVDLLKRDESTVEERKSYIETLDMKSQRLKRLIEDLFEVSKASSNNVTINLVEVDLANLIKQVVLELDDKIKAAEIEVRLNLPENKVILNLDSEKTYRIFENLMINITKYAMPHTRAYIDMSVNEEFVTVAVKNVSSNELNFSPEEITERFVRGDLSRNTEGSGLGLAITKSFVELQNGKFNIVADGDLFKAMIEWKYGQISL